MNLSTESTPPFRPDIEGLRAIAILLVVAAHAGVSWLGGGFVGVDVFFVLSGYLITALLVTELSETGRLRLLDFYARRMRRLLPALLLVVVTTIAAAAILLSPQEQLQQVLSAGTALLWLSNLHFAFQRIDYFGPAADSNLFLHTWSLGVEEQFYLAWPILLLFFAGAFSRLAQQPGAAIDIKRVTPRLVALVVVCFGLSVFLSYVQPAWAYYLPISRAWQFGIGAVAAIWALRSASPSLPPGTGWVGLLLILGSALAVDEHTPYPGIWALVPTLGTAMVLVAGVASPTGSAGRFLGIAPLTAIGRVSYGWYLWHWPVFLLGWTLLPNDNAWYSASLAALSLALAGISYRLVEAPCRTSTRLKRRPRLVLAGSTILIGGAVVLTANWQRQAETWAETPDQMRYALVRADAPVIYQYGCDEWFHTARVKECIFGDENAERTAVLIGDSIAGQWFPAVAKVFQRPGWRLVIITKSACPMVDSPVFYARIGRMYVECDAWRAAAIARISELQPEIVILGSSKDYAFGRPEWLDGTQRILAGLAPHSRRVFILRATHTLPFDGPNCLSRAEWRNAALRNLVDLSGCDAPALTPGSIEDQVHAWLVMATEGFTNAQVLDLNPQVCPLGRCRAMQDGTIVFRDFQHLTASFAERLYRPMSELLGMPP